MKTVRFRESEFIDFNSGQVKIAPMDLTRQFQIAGATGPEAGIRLFQCQIDVWMLGVAVQILKEIESHEPPSTWSHAAYGLISVVFPYFEMIGKTLNPGSKRVRTAGQDFNYGFCDVYP
ncbi:MAG: hypothetical protein KDI03_22215, partial [Anaerolineae bacterium]|nr:hypothetical protein [Anaerolineae bacterium]